ncbi:endo-beta-N-acetylglucosaminidase D [Bradyrhizobium sp. LM2.7]
MAAGQDERVFNQFLEFNFSMRSANEIDAKVGFSARYRFQFFIGADVQNADANARVRFGEPADRSRQEIEYCRRHRSHRDQT